MRYNNCLSMILFLNLTGCASETFLHESVYPDMNGQYTPGDSSFQSYSNNQTVFYDEKIETHDMPDTTTTVHSKQKIQPQTANQNDLNWVRAQSSYAYTIKLAEDPQASKVAKVLHAAPKTNHVAEVPGKRGYIGVFGSYETREEAERAVKALPASIQQNASITQWQEIQRDN